MQVVYIELPTNKDKLFICVETKMWSLPNYCPKNTNVLDIWTNNGTLSECFVATTTTSVLAVYLLVFGLRLMWMCKKYGIPRSHVNHDIIPRADIFIVLPYCSLYL